MANPADIGTFNYWITDRIFFWNYRARIGHIGDFEKWITDRIFWEDYQRVPEGIPPYEIIPECETAIWIIDEDLAPTGNVVAGPGGTPFIVHEELTPTGNTYIREPDTPQVADSDNPTYFGVWKKKGHA